MDAARGPVAASRHRGARWGIRLVVALAVLGASIAPARAEPTAEIPPGTYVVEPAHTSLLFQVRRMGLSKVVGTFDAVTGELKVSPDGGTLRVVIAAGDVKAATEKSTRMMRGPSFFDVDHHPEIRFTAPRVRAVNDLAGSVNGMLTLLGVTHPVTFEATFHDGGVDPVTGRDTLNLSLHGVIDRSAYGMTAYLPLVSDRAKLDLEARMIRQPGGSSARDTAPGISGHDP